MAQMAESKEPHYAFDVDMESRKFDDEFNRMSRLGFIKKVYGILTVQLALTVGWCALALT